VIDGSRKRLDLAYPKKMIAIEADGFEFHSSLVDFLRDRARQNALVALGWRVLRFTSADAKRPNRFLADLADLMAA
jgi:very-short-patch-repair endonuclease